MISKGRPSPDFDDLDFEIINEGWNEYELAGHTKVRGRAIVTRFVHDPNNPDPKFISMSSQNVFVITSPIEQRGPPSPLTAQEIKKPKGGAIEVTSSNEKWSKYRIKKTGLILKVKLVLHEAYRIDGRFDNDGMPAYVFTSGPLLIPDTSETGISV